MPVQAEATGSWQREGKEHTYRSAVWLPTEVTNTRGNLAAWLGREGGNRWIISKLQQRMACPKRWTQGVAPAKPKGSKTTSTQDQPTAALAPVPTTQSFFLGSPQSKSRVEATKASSPAAALLCCPQLEGPVVGAGGNELPIEGDVQAHHLPLVPCQRLQRGPAGVGPDLGGVVVGAGQQEVAVVGCGRAGQRGSSDWRAAPGPALPASTGLPALKGWL